MRLGLIARCDHKGLGQQTAAVWRNMAPVKTLLILMGELSGLEEHPEYFPDARVCRFNGGRIPVEDQDWLLDGVDTIYTAETPYDFGLFLRAERAGVRTVLHLNPELDHHQKHPETPRPSVVALPTEWLAERYPNAVSLPMPVEPVTVERGMWAVHPGGWPAAKDRNGTRLVIEASVNVGGIKIRSQVPPDQPWRNASVEVGDFPTIADVLAGAQMVVLPRRYGGLYLVLQEAMAAGLPVLHIDRKPYGPQLPPEARLPVADHEVLHVKGGSIRSWRTSPASIAKAISTVRNDPDLADHLAAHSRMWAAMHSWAALRPIWDEVLFG